MNDKPKFGMFDRERETSIENRYLPHWFQLGVAVFITLRTADSLPKHVILQWHQELLEWLRKAGVAVRQDREPPRVEMIPIELQKDYQKLRDRLWHWHLDSCHGRCVLRQRDLAQLVMDSLLHFNEERYELASAIVMPNHVHLIAQFYAPTTCRAQCTSWMHYSAGKINQSLGQSGAFWQSEPFDHLIRSETQFHYLQEYIAENGRMAGLPPSDYLYWHM